MATRFADRLRALPNKPGVYRMYDGEGNLIYVGKAGSLRNRVRSYFGSPHSLEGKTRILSEAIADFDFVVTHNEAEALHLEDTLVKQHQPQFNVRLKDDKHYPYLKVDLAEDFPRIYITRRIEADGARYFGPYANTGSVRQTLEVTKRLFPWCSRKIKITGKEARPCLDYYLGRCLGACAGLVSEKEYREVIDQAILFLEGQTDEVVRQLRDEMSDASAALQFERAARLRDQVAAIEQFTERQVTAGVRQADDDVFGLARSDGDACVEVLFIRGTRMVGAEHFLLDGTREETDEEVIAAFLERFYGQAAHIPRRVILPLALSDAPVVREWLASRRTGAVDILVPERGEKRRLVRMAASNAREALDMSRVKWLADKRNVQTALADLQEQLHLPSPPDRIECYDISNIQGVSATGSMVVFVDGRPKSSEYRRFRIKTVEGSNDVAMMAEVLRRRFRRARPEVKEAQPPDGGNLNVVGEGFSPPAGAVGGASALSTQHSALPDDSFAKMPSLIIVDGGKPQLGAALDALQDAGIDVPVVGLAKRNEEIFVPDVSEPVVLPRSSQALYLVQRIRDEAHRFAITYHRKVHQKSEMRSALDAVSGVGPKRRKALLRKFGSVKGIREAPVEDIAATPGFTRSLAQRVKEAL